MSDDKKFGRHEQIVPLKRSDKFPGHADKVWFEWTRPLKEFLRTPRTWKGLKRWSHQGNISVYVTRNLIAWLETNGEIEFKRGKWVANDTGDEENT